MIEYTVLFIWSISLVYTAWLAETYQKSLPLWVAMGVLLGPFAVIIFSILAFKHRKDHYNDRRKSTSDYDYRADD